MSCAPGLGWPLACCRVLKGLLYSLPTITFISSSSAALLSTQFLSLYSSWGKSLQARILSLSDMTLREMWPDTQKGKGDDGGYRPATAEDSDNHESPVGEKVGFSESPKGKHPDPGREIGARGNSDRNALLLEALNMLREAAPRKTEICKNYRFFPWQSNKVFPYRKMALIFLMPQKMNDLLVHRILSKDSGRWTSKGFYRKYTIYLR